MWTPEAISKARTSAEGTLGKARSTLESAVIDAEALFKEVDAGPDKDLLRGASALVKSRLTFALSVLDSAAGADLSSLVQQVQDKAMKPPCKLWQELKTMPALEKDLQDAFEKLATSEACEKELIAETVKGAAQKKEAISELAKALNAAAKDLKTAKTTREKMFQAKAKAKAASKKAGGKDPGTTPASTPGSRFARAARMAKPIFEFCSSFGEEIREFPMKADLAAAAAEDGDLNCNMPFVLRDPTVQEESTAEAGLKSAMDSFRASWPTSAVRANPGRGLLRLRDPTVSSAARCLMSSSMNKFHLAVPEDASELRQSMSSSIFAIAVGNEAGYIEQNGLPTLRMALAGSRVVCMCAATTAAKVLNINMGCANSFSKLSQAFLAATQAKVETLGHHLLYSSVGAGEVLFTPMGWVVCESAGQGGGPRTSNKDVGASCPSGCRATEWTVLVDHPRILGVLAT